MKKWTPPDDTRYIQILTRNTPVVPCANPEYRYINILTPALYSVNRIIKRRSSDQTSVVQTTINTVKSQIPVNLSIIINPVHKFKVLHSIEKSIFSDQF